MREFILLSLKGSTSPLFELDEKTEAGLICRTIANTLWISAGIRPDTILHVVLNGPPASPRVISFDGSLIKDLWFDERSVAICVRGALAAGNNLAMHAWKDVAPGIRVGKESFEWLVQNRAASGKPLYYLHKKGDDVRSIDSSEEMVFIFGDLFGIPKNTEKLLKRLEATRVTLGPTMLFASHCPVLVHNELDRKRSGWD